MPGYVHYDIAHLPRSSAAGLLGPVSIAELTSAAGRGDWKAARLPISQQRRWDLYGRERQGRRQLSMTTITDSVPRFVDVDNDGKVDLLVANDSSSNYLYINKGDGTFEDASFYSGFWL